MKLLLMPDNYQQIIENYNQITGIIVGIKQLSCHVPFLLTEDEIAGFLKKHSDKDIFFCLNENYQEDDLPYLKKILKKLQKQNVLFYDLAVVNLNHDLSLKLNLFWDNERYTTNNNSFRLLQTYGVKGMVVSLDLNIKENQALAKHKSGIFLQPIFGYFPLFHAHRHLIKNFFEYYQINEKMDQLKLIVNDRHLLITDDNKTTIYSELINGFNLIKKMSHIDYFVINGFNIDNDDLKKVLTENLAIGSDAIFFQQQQYRLKGEK